MALTRGSTGNARPRKFDAPAPPAAAATTTTKKRSTKAKTATGRVAKPRAAGPAAAHGRKPTPGDKVEAAVEKAKGAVERKPGKKGRLLLAACRSVRPRAGPCHRSSRRGPSERCGESIGPFG
jgi:hypothetical protein